VQDAYSALRALALFAAVSDDEVARLAGSAFPRRLVRGQVLFTEGERSEHLFAVTSGRLKVVVTSPQGDELVLAVLGPTDALGELSVLDGASRSAGAVAVDDVVLWCVPAEQVRDLLRRSPAVAMAVAVELAAQVRRLTGAAADLVFLDLPRRLAKLLVADAAAEGLNGLSQGEVAAQLGVTRQTLNRALQRFQDRGWIEVHRGAVVVRDRPALRRFSQT
jgi:CRP/FNR family cyclic AMP-dependent transcriptional regulator